LSRGDIAEDAQQDAALAERRESVYEESQANPSWGQHMTPRYREMILENDELTPVSKLSGAFLSPKSEQHLQFAYYESSLAVEFFGGNDLVWKS